VKDYEPGTISIRADASEHDKAVANDLQAFLNSMSAPTRHSSSEAKTNISIVSGGHVKGNVKFTMSKSTGHVNAKIVSDGGAVDGDITVDLGVESTAVHVTPVRQPSAQPPPYNES
jgi:hypothetical protein